MLQVALVPPYKRGYNVVKPMPKSDGEARRYTTRGHIEDIREHGRKKKANKLTVEKCQRNKTKTFAAIAQPTQLEKQQGKTVVNHPTSE